MGHAEDMRELAEEIKAEQDAKEREAIRRRIKVQTLPIVDWEPVTLHPKQATLPGLEEYANDSSVNNGGSTDYYKFDPEWVECADIIEARGMNYNQGNIFKSAFCFNVGRHEGTSYERELNKIIYFAQRELKGIKNGK